MDSLSTTYKLVHNFLVARGHTKAAVSVKKACQETVDLTKSPDVEESLDQIVTFWREKKLSKPSKPSKARSSSSSSDSSSSSSESSDAEPSKAPAVNGLKTKTKTKKHKSSSSSSSSDSDTDTKPTKAALVAKKKKKKDSHSSSSSASANDTKKEKTVQKRPASSSNSSDPDSDSPEQPKKKAKLDTTTTVTMEKVVVQTVETTTADSTPVPESNGKAPKGKRKPNTPFQRIKVDSVTFADNRLRDNTYDSKPGTANDYGARASQDLIVTRGAGFRKEKNKKKRGSYRGGEITLQNHAIRFED